MNNEKLEAIAREVRRLTLGYAALHFDGKDRMCNPAYVSEYLRGLMDAPIDVSGLAATFAAQPAEQASAEEEDAESGWRRLALQFDGHRMQALGHLKSMVKDPAVHRDQAEKFLSAGPLSGEEVLAERIKAIAEQASAGSIGDDREFCRLALDWCNASGSGKPTWERLTAYIDSRPRQAAQRAPSDTQSADVELPEERCLHWDGVNGYEADQMLEFGAQQREAALREAAEYVRIWGGDNHAEAILTMRSTAPVAALAQQAPDAARDAWRDEAAPPRVIAVLEKLLDRALFIQDEGPEDEGWKSKELLAEIAAAEEIISAHHAKLAEAGKGE